MISALAAVSIVGAALSCVFAAVALRSSAVPRRLHKRVETCEQAVEGELLKIEKVRREAQVLVEEADQVYERSRKLRRAANADRVNAEQRDAKAANHGTPNLAGMTREQVIQFFEGAVKR